MDCKADPSFEAGRERIRQARVLYHDESNADAVAMHTTGPAVECMWRAFRWLKAPSLKAAHETRDALDGETLRKRPAKRAHNGRPKA